MMAVDFLDVFYGANKSQAFTADLFRLIKKAKPDEIMKISYGFRREVQLFRWWQISTPTPKPQEVMQMASKLESL